jgi:lysophospholipase L1-like esterase
MAKILELHSAKVTNTLNDVLPPTNRVYCSKWYDNSGNNNHGVLNSFDFNTNEAWVGSSSFNDYYGLQFGVSNNASLTVPTLYDTAFPQSQGTVLFDINIKEFNTNLSWILDNSSTRNNFCMRTINSGAEYGIQLSPVGNDGVFKGVIDMVTATNRILLNTVNKIAFKYITGASGYTALFINGVKIKQTNISDAGFVPSSQKVYINPSSDSHVLHHFEIYNTALTDAEIIAIQNAEWKTTPYALPTLNKSYVAYGDSTVWTAASGKEYPNLVHNYIKNTYGKAHYYNKGIGGITSAGLVTNLNSLNYIDGEIVTIGVGMNDCASQGVSVANYTTNLGLAIDFIRSRNASAKIILCTPSGTSDANRTPYIASYRAAMEAVATAKSCYLCKFHEAVTDANIATYSSDGIHPNAAGHVLLFEKLQTIIDEIF